MDTFCIYLYTKQTNDKVPDHFTCILHICTYSQRRLSPQRKTWTPTNYNTCSRWWPSVASSRPGQDCLKCGNYRVTLVKPTDWGWRKAQTGSIGQRCVHGQPINRVWVWWSLVQREVSWWAPHTPPLQGVQPACASTTDLREAVKVLISDFFGTLKLLLLTLSSLL